MWVPLLAALTISTHTFIDGGPVFTGGDVLWSTATPAVYSTGPVRRVWRPGRVSVPPDLRTDPKARYEASQLVTDLASSASTTAFVRTVGFRRIPECVNANPPCLGGPLRSVPFRGELWVRRGSGAFRRLAGGLHRPLVVATDVDKSTVVYAEEGSVNRVVVLRRNGPPEVLTSSPELKYPRVAVAGDFVAWLEGDERSFGYPRRSLVVYDLRTRSIAYRLAAAPIVELDLAASGTVAFGQDPTPIGGPNGGIGWASLAEPQAHFLPGDAIPFRLKLAAGRVAFFTRICCPRDFSPFLIKSLTGDVLSRRSAAYGDFDLDAHRVTYLRSVKVIGVDRLR
jgi:hypothetical protein